MDNQETEPMDLQDGAAAIAGLMDNAEEVEDQSSEEAEPQETEQVEESEELDTEPKYKVKVNGEERLVALPDLIKGHMMHEDYTRKTTELAKEKQTLEQKIRTEASQAYMQQLQDMNARLVAVISQDQQIDWADLAKNDPAMYVQKMHEAQQRQQAQQDLQQRLKLEADRNLAETLTRENTKLLERRPEWSDPKKREEDFAAMRGYLAKDYGFSDNEINSLTDSRQMDIVWKATQYDKLQASKPQVTKKVEKLPVRTERPGVGSDGGNKRSAKDRLYRTGSVDDAAKALREMMG